MKQVYHFWHQMIWHGDKETAWCEHVDNLTEKLPAHFQCNSLSPLSLKKQQCTVCVCPSCVRTASLSPPPTLAFLIVAFLNCVNDSEGGWEQPGKMGEKGEVIFHINAYTKMRSCGEVMSWILRVLWGGGDAQWHSFHNTSLKVALSSPLHLSSNTN